LVLPGILPDSALPRYFRVAVLVPDMLGVLAHLLWLLVSPITSGASSELFMWHPWCLSLGPNPRGGGVLTNDRCRSPWHPSVADFIFARGRPMFRHQLMERTTPRC